MDNIEDFYRKIADQIKSLDYQREIYIGQLINALERNDFFTVEKCARLINNKSRAIRRLKPLLFDLQTML